MDFLLKQTLNKLGNSPTNIVDNQKKIYSQFPIPKEHKILWADVKFGRRVSGLVLTNIGCFIKADSETVKEYNKGKENKKEHVKSIFHYIKWEFFSIDDFEFRKIDGNTVIYFNNVQVLFFFKNIYRHSVY